MRSSKSIADIYKAEEKSFLKHLKSAKTLDEREIHKFRVDIKKMRSLYKFLELLSNKKFKRKKIMKLVSPVFKSAGKIRTTTLNLKLAGNYKSSAVSGFKKYLKEKEKLEENNFRKEANRFNKKKFDKLQKKILYDFKISGEALVRKTRGKYVKDIFLKIKKNLLQISNDEYFHDIRKQLKDLKTIKELLGDSVPAQKTELDNKFVKLIEEKIGKWHDHVMLVSELEKFISQTKKGNGISEKGQNKKLSMLAINLKSNNEINKKLIAQRLKKKLF